MARRYIQIALAALVFGQVTSPDPATDACAIAFGPNSFCNDFGVCATTTQTCDDVFRALSHTPVMLPLLPSGRLIMPYRMEVVNPFEPIDMNSFSPAKSLQTTIRSRINNFSNHLSQLNARISANSPKVLYVPRIHRTVLRRAHLMVTRMEPDVTRYKALQHEVSAQAEILLFMFLVADAAETLMGMRSSNDQKMYLENLIPYLHLFAEIGYALKIESIPLSGFWTRNFDLITTIVQYAPDYLQVDFESPETLHRIWRIRDFSPTDHRWMEYVWEKPLLAVSQPKRERFISHTLGCDLKSTSVESPLAACVSTFSDSIQLITDFSEFPAASVQLLAYILYWTDREQDPQAILAIKQFCDRNPQMTNYLQIFANDHIPGNAALRFSTSLIGYCRSSIEFESRMFSLLAVSATRVAVDMGRQSLPMYSWITISHEAIAQLGKLDKRMLYRAFTRNLVESQESVFVYIRDTCMHRHKDPTTEQPSCWKVTDATRDNFDLLRGIGRLIAVNLYYGLPSVTLKNILEHNAVPGISMDQFLFFNSEYIKRGFYDWFRYDSMEILFAPEEILRLKPVGIHDESTFYPTIEV